MLYVRLYWQSSLASEWMATTRQLQAASYYTAIKLSIQRRQDLSNILIYLLFFGGVKSLTFSELVLSTNFCMSRTFPYTTFPSKVTDAKKSNVPPVSLKFFFLLSNSHCSAPVKTNIPKGRNSFDIFSHNCQSQLKWLFYFQLRLRNDFT